MVALASYELRNFLSQSGDYIGVKCLWVRAALGLAVVAGTVALAGTPASAHNSFSSSTPKDKAVLDQVPTVVTLKFLARLSPQGTKVTLVGPDGSSAAAGPARFDGPSVTVPVRASVAGLYTASYEVASSDGHPITGKITFTLTERAVPSPGPAAPETTAAPAPTSTAAPVPSLRTTASDAAGGMPWWPWVLGALAVAAAVALLVVRQRRAR